MLDLTGGSVGGAPALLIEDCCPRGKAWISSPVTDAPGMPCTSCVLSPGSRLSRRRTLPSGARAWGPESRARAVAKSAKQTAFLAISKPRPAGTGPAQSSSVKRLLPRRESNGVVLAAPPRFAVLPVSRCGVLPRTPGWSGGCVSRALQADSPAECVMPSSRRAVASAGPLSAKR